MHKDTCVVYGLVDQHKGEHTAQIKSQNITSMREISPRPLQYHLFPTVSVFVTKDQMDYKVSRYGIIHDAFFLPDFFSTQYHVCKVDLILLSVHVGLGKDYRAGLLWSQQIPLHGFTKWLYQFVLLRNSYKSLGDLYTPKHLILWGSFNFYHSGKCFLVCMSLMTNETEHFFKCYLSFGYVLLCLGSCPFFSWAVCFSW